MKLAEKLIAIHRSLDDGGVPHAFGGAIALAFWTLDPRGTRDIDVNVFLPQGRFKEVLDLLPEAIEPTPEQLATIERDGQGRLHWGDTPIDLFFSTLPIHDEAESHRRRVPFEGEQIPVLGPLELAVFKAMFDRTKDWADIEAMFVAKALDPDALREHLRQLVDDDDQRLTRVADAVQRADEAPREST